MIEAVTGLTVDIVVPLVEFPVNSFSFYLEDVPIEERFIMFWKFLDRCRRQPLLAGQLGIELVFGHAPRLSHTTFWLPS